MHKTSRFFSVLDALEKILGALSRLVERISDAVVIVCGFVIIGTLALAVLTRYTALASFLWTDEVARYSMIWMAFLGASSALKKGEFLAFDLLVSKMRGRAQAYAGLLITVCCLVFLGIFLHCGLEALPITWIQKSSALGLPMFYPAFGIIVGCAFMGVHLLLKLAVETRQLFFHKTGSR